MKPCLSEATTLPCTFAEDVAHFADAGATAIEIWLTKLEAHLEKQSIAERQSVNDYRSAIIRNAYTAMEKEL